MDVYQRRRLVALSSVVGVFVIVVLAVASGGGDDDAAPPTAVTGATGEQGPQTLSKQQYIRQADSSCAEVNSSLETIDATDASQAAQQETQIMSGLLQRLQTLPPPDRDRRSANDFLGALEDQVDALRNRRLAVDRGADDALIDIDATLATAEGEAQVAAEEFGFEICGNPEALTDTGEEGVEPVDPAPVDPAPVEPAPVEPPAEPPPDDGGDTGGVSPGDDGTGGVSP